MKNNKLAIHVLAWIAIIAINLFILKGSGYSDYGMRLCATTFLWLVYFYINYLVLIPCLLFKKKITLYILTTVLCFAGAYFLSKYSDIRITETELRHQYESLSEYDDIKDSWEAKTEEYRRRRDRREHGDSTKQAMVDPFAGMIRRGDGSVNRYANFPPPYEDSRERIGFTEREEEYDRALRDYDRAHRRFGWLQRSNYNPLEGYNSSYFFLLVFFYLASLAVSFIEKSGKESERRSELENEKVAAELAYLKQQINPHFLFNTLNAIYSYTIPISDEASEAVLKLSAILRYMLYETDRDRVPLSDEISVLYDYIELQKLRITDMTEIKFDITGNPSEHLIEPMLLIPILENAFKYGVDSLRNSFIYILLKIENNKIIFDVSNRIVRREDGHEGSSGIGIKNIRRRLKLIYGNNYQLITEEKDGIFYVSLSLNTEKRLDNEMYSR
ncbi:MAG: histidine kinase [Rikenellaceae bacterium]|nr:histidine kinase [Rikenellaceae bacterium]